MPSSDSDIQALVSRIETIVNGGLSDGAKVLSISNVSFENGTVSYKVEIGYDSSKTSEGSIEAIVGSAAESPQSVTTVPATTTTVPATTTTVPATTVPATTTTVPATTTTVPATTTTVSTTTQPPPTTTTTTTTTTTLVSAPFKWSTSTSGENVCDGGYQVISSADICSDAADWVTQGNNAPPGVISPTPVDASYFGILDLSHVAYGCFWDGYDKLAFNPNDTLVTSNYLALCSAATTTTSTTTTTVPVNPVNSTICVMTVDKHWVPSVVSWQESLESAEYGFTRLEPSQELYIEINAGASMGYQYNLTMHCKYFADSATLPPVPEDNFEGGNARLQLGLCMYGSDVNTAAATIEGNAFTTVASSDINGHELFFQDNPYWDLYGFEGTPCNNGGTLLQAPTILELDGAVASVTANPFKWGPVNTAGHHVCNEGYQVISSADICEDAADWVALGNYGPFTDPIPVGAPYDGEWNVTNVAHGCFWNPPPEASSGGAIYMNFDQSMVTSNFPALCYYSE